MSDFVQGSQRKEEQKGRQSLVFVGDVGGTNARFAIADLSDRTKPLLSHGLSLRAAEYETLEAAIAAYLPAAGVAPPPATVIDIAGPVINGEATMTNLSWHISEAKLKLIGFLEAKLINDFSALAAAAEVLDERDVAPIGPAERYAPARTVALIGAGTGLGVSALIREDGASIVLASEGGHIGFSPGNELEVDVYRILSRRFGHVSTERVASGPGLVNLYEALCELRGAAAEFHDPPAISTEAQRGPGLCREVVELFFAIMGSVAGDVALMFGANAVLLTGGVTTALQSFLQASAFRMRFEAKGRMSKYLQAIPTYLITRKDAALLGCARIASQM